MFHVKFTQAKIKPSAPRKKDTIDDVRISAIDKVAATHSRIHTHRCSVRISYIDIG